MKLLIIWLLSIVVPLIQDIPYKPQDDFNIKFDLSFKQRDSAIGSTTFNMSETRAEHERRTSTDQLPYLLLHVELKKVAAGEVKGKIIRDEKDVIFNKKIKEGLLIKLDVGFTDDLKDQIKGYKHEIQFIKENKSISSRIVIEFDKEGNYFVNGEKRGKI